jgi:hypothetical protein
VLASWSKNLVHVLRLATRPSVPYRIQALAAIAITFDFVNPVGALRRVVGQG